MQDVYLGCYYHRDILLLGMPVTDNVYCFLDPDKVAMVFEERNLKIVTKNVISRDLVGPRVDQSIFFKKTSQSDFFSFYYDAARSKTRASDILFVNCVSCVKIFQALETEAPRLATIDYAAAVHCSYSSGIKFDPLG